MQATAGKSDVFSSQGISVSIPHEAANPGPSHIPTAERKLFLRCLWKVGIPLQSKPGNQLSSGDDLRYTELSSRCCAELRVPLVLGRYSQGNFGVA